MSLFPKRLYALKQKSGKTQAKIASELGISPQAFSNYMKGREPDYDTLIKMSSYFDVSLDYLLGVSENTKPVDVDSLLPNTDAINVSSRSYVKKIASDLVSMSVDFYNTAPYYMSDLLTQEMAFLAQLTSLTKDFLGQIVEVNTKGKEQKEIISSYQGKLSLEVISNSIKLTEKVARYQVQRALDHAEKLKAEYESLADPNSLEQAGPLKKINEEIQSLKMMLKAADGAFYYFFFDDDQEAGEPDGQHPKD